MLKTESINTYVLCVIQCNSPPTFLEQPVFVGPALLPDFQVPDVKRKKNSG